MKKLMVFLFAFIFLFNFVSAWNFEGEAVTIVNPLESNGAIPVNIQDQTTPPVDIFFVQLNGTITTLQQDSSIDDTTINVTSVADISAGTYLGLSGRDRYYFGEVLSVSGNIVGSPSFHVISA